MEEPRKRWGDQERKKMAVTTGGGIGAVVLLGGALATAALASAFIVRKKGRSSGKDATHHRRQSQDSLREISKQSKEDEENKGEKFIFLDQPSHVHKPLSGGETKQVEQDNHTGSLISTEIVKLDEKARDEINGTRSGVYDDDFVIIEDKKLSFEPQTTMQEDEVKTELNKEDVCNKISQASKNIAEVANEGESAERDRSDDGEINGINLSHKEAIEMTEMQPGQEENAEVCYDQEEIEVTIEDSVLEGVHNDEREVLKNVIMEVNIEEKELERFCSDNGEINEKKCVENSEALVSESHSDDGKEVLLPVFESRVIEEKKVNGDEKERNLVTEIVEIIQFDEVKCIEKLVKEEDKCDQIDRIVVEKGEDEGWAGKNNQSNTQSSMQIEMGEEKIDSESKEDDASTGNPTPENGQFGVPVLEEEVISYEVTKEYGADVEDVAESREVDKDETSMIVENLGKGKEKTAIVAENQEEDEEKIAIVAESLEVNEDETSMVAQNLEVDKEKNVMVAERLEVNEDETSMVAENLEVGKKKIAIVAESLEVKEDNCQPKDKEDDSKENVAKKVEEELISPDDAPVINELKDNKIWTELADNYQPKDHEDDMERKIATEVDEDVICPDNIEVTKENSENEEVEAGIAKAEDDMIMETSEDEEKGTSEDEEKGEANLPDEVEESSVGTGDSSMESNSEAIWPAESLQEMSAEPQKKLIDQEVEGKIEEDKLVEESEYNSQDSSFDPYQVNTGESDSCNISANLPTEVVSSQFPQEKRDSDETFVKKYVVNSTRRRMLIGALSVVSSLSCSWFFGLSFIKLCLIVFLTMVLSKIHGY